MVFRQIERRGVGDRRVLDAMRRAPRALFVSAEQSGEAYADHPLAIGEGQTISQPYIVALMAELACLKPTDRVLEVGAGCGYQTYVLSLLCDRVYAIECREGLMRGARERLDRLGVENAQYRVGDGRKGWREAAPFDAIIVATAPLETPPQLREQLADGGRLVLPVGPVDNQRLVTITRDGDRFRQRKVICVRFVPMV